MNKAVLISIQPKWCELIASGKKTVEVRKTKPKIDEPFKCYIYCTKGESLMKTAGNSCFIDKGYRQGENLYGLYELTNGKVIGEFMCNKMLESFLNNNDGWFVEKGCLTPKEIDEYQGDKAILYGWHISDLVIYDKPKELSEFYQNGKSSDTFYYDYCTGCSHHETPIGEYPCNECDGNRKYLYRPPQSWCYVEERSNR